MGVGGRGPSVWYAMDYGNYETNLNHRGRSCGKRGGLAASGPRVLGPPCGKCAPKKRERPCIKPAVCAELVCSNSLKSTKPESAAGMLKAELAALGSQVHAAALDNAVAAGGALAVDREAFARQITAAHPGAPGHFALSTRRCARCSSGLRGRRCRHPRRPRGRSRPDALAAEPPPASPAPDHLAFYDAAAPIVMADSLDGGRAVPPEPLRGCGSGRAGDYLNAPCHARAVRGLRRRSSTAAERVDAGATSRRASCSRPASPSRRSPARASTRPRFGPLKPVGLHRSRARAGAHGPPRSRAPRTRTARATTWWVSRPT